MPADDVARQRASELKALEQELAAVRKRRIAMQRTVAEGPGLMVSAERVDRDRSALSSPQVEELRQRTQQRYDDVSEVWAGVDRTRHLLTLLRRVHADDYSALKAALDAEAGTRRQAAAAAASAGIDLPVPGVAAESQE